VVGLKPAKSELRRLRKAKGDVQRNKSTTVVKNNLWMVKALVTEEIGIKVSRQADGERWPPMCVRVHSRARLCVCVCVCVGLCVTTYGRLNGVIAPDSRDIITCEPGKKDFWGPSVLKAQNVCNQLVLPNKQFMYSRVDKIHVR